jgi:hypothetical protein
MFFLDLNFQFPNGNSLTTLYQATTTITGFMFSSVGKLLIGQDDNMIRILDTNGQETLFVEIFSASL